mgnify:FL=1
MINDQDLTATMQNSQVMNQAKAMLDQNIPMETIAQQTGLDRNTLNNLLMQNQLMPGSVQPTPLSESIPVPQDFSGIMNSGSTTADEIATLITDDSEESRDLQDMLDGIIGINTDEEDMTDNQILNSMQIGNVKNNPSGMALMLENMSVLEDLPDADVIQKYKDAAAMFVDKPNYEELISDPSSALPYLVAGMSLIDSDARGDTWGQAVGKALIGGYGTKIKEDKAYDAKVSKLDLAYNNSVNSVMMNLVNTDFTTKAAIRKSIIDSGLKEPISVQKIGPSGTFADGDLELMSVPAFNRIIKNAPGTVRKDPEEKLEDYTLTTEDGGSIYTPMSPTAARNFIPVALGGTGLYYGKGFSIQSGKITDTASALKNVLLTNLDGSTSDGMMTMSQIQTARDSGDYKSIDVNTGNAAGMKPVFSITGGGPTFASDRAIRESGGDLIPITQNLQATINADGSTDVTYGSGGSGGIIRNRVKTSDAYYNDQIGLFKGVLSNTQNYLDKAGAVRDLLIDADNRSPGTADLLFDNFAGNTIEFAKNLVVNVNAFNSYFKSTSEDTSNSFEFTDANGKTINYEDYKNSVINSEEFEAVMEGNLAQSLLRLNEDKAVVQSAMFGIAMSGAAAAGGDPSGKLDLRAISDYETKNYIKEGGGMATTLNEFLRVNSHFSLGLLKKARRTVSSNINPATMENMYKTDGSVDVERQKDLIKRGNLILETIDLEIEKFNTGNPSSNGSNPNGAIQIVAGIAEGDEDANKKSFNLPIGPDSNPRAYETLQLSRPYTLMQIPGRDPKQRTYRQLLQTYANLKNSPTRQSEFINSLNPNVNGETSLLNAEEFRYFTAVVTTARNTGVF